MLHVAMVPERLEVGKASGPAVALRVVLLVAVTSASAAVLLRGAGGSYRPNLLLLAAAFAGLGTLVVLELHRLALARGLLIGATGALLVIAVVVPPVQSNDLWLYATYGRMVSHHGISPYAAPPSRVHDDPLYPRVDSVWRGTRSLYGPGFIAIAAAGTAVTGDSALAVRLLFQGLAAAAVLTALLLVDRRTKDPIVWLLVGVNPMVIVGVVNGGHNDALVALALLGGVLLAVVRRPVLTGAAVALGVLVKIVMMLPLAALLVWLWRRQGLRAALVTGGVAAVLVVGAYLLAGGRTALEPVSDAEHQVSRSSIWNKPRRDMTFDLVRDGATGKVAGAIARRRVTRWANLAVAGLAVLLVAPRMRARSPAVLVGAATLAYLLAGAYVVPWYAVWALPLLALAPRSWVTGVTLAIAAVVSLAYVPDPSMIGHAVSVVTPWQALRYDIFAMWVPLSTWTLIAVVVALTIVTIRRRPAQDGAGPAISAMTPK